MRRKLRRKKRQVKKDLHNLASKIWKELREMLLTKKETYKYMEFKK